MLNKDGIEQFILELVWQKFDIIADVFSHEDDSINPINRIYEILKDGDISEVSCARVRKELQIIGVDDIDSDSLLEFCNDFVEQLMEIEDA